MLKDILSISGRQGLFKLISYGKNIIVVESLLDGKRTAATARDRIVSLGDIAIYTTGDDRPLGQVLEAVKEKTGGKPVDAAVVKDPAALTKFIKEVLPEFDEERVHQSDIKKLATWYNILVNAGITTFVEPPKAEDDKETNEEKAEAEPQKK